MKLKSITAHGLLCDNHEAYINVQNSICEHIKSKWVLSHFFTCDILVLKM